MMRRTDSNTAVRVLVTMAAVLLLGGCATKSDIRDLRTEIQGLAARQDSLMAELNSAMLSAQDTIRGQSAQLFDFRGEIFRRLREIAQGLDRVEALTGENQRGIAGVRDQMANLRRGAATPPPVETEAEGAVAPTVGAAGGDAQGIFNAAVSQFNRGQLSTARTAFEQFLQGSPSHALAPDAHFFLADILVQEDRPEDALEAFQEIAELFPTAAKVPDALYRIALLQIELDRESDARATLERIVNTYPGTGVAMLATEKLRELG